MQNKSSSSSGTSYQVNRYFRLLDYDECQEDQNIVCEDSSTICVNSEGSFHCECVQGYWRPDDSQSCEDWDECNCGLNKTECDTFICGQLRVCTNSPGSFTCDCQERYVQGVSDFNCVGEFHKKSAN